MGNQTNFGGAFGRRVRNKCRRSNWGTDSRGHDRACRRAASQDGWLVAEYLADHLAGGGFRRLDKALADRRSDRALGGLRAAGCRVSVPQGHWLPSDSRLSAGIRENLQMSMIQ